MNRLSSTELVAASVIGVPEQYIAQRASGCNPRKRVDFFLQIFQKFTFFLLMCLSGVTSVNLNISSTICSHTCKLWPQIAGILSGQFQLAGNVINYNA